MLPKVTYDIEVPLHQNMHLFKLTTKTYQEKKKKKHTYTHTHNTLFPSKRSELKGAFGWVDFKDERK